MIERAIELEEKRHLLKNKKEMDKVQLAFSRILMAAAILTLGLILLSSFEIPFVNVSPEVVKLMINAVIVEIAGIVSLGLINHLGKVDKDEPNQERRTYPINTSTTQVYLSPLNTPGALLI